MATRARSDSAKSSSPRIAAAVICFDLRPGSGVVGEHLDHLAGDQGGVDVEDDQPLGPAVETRPLDGDVDAGSGADLDHRRPQRLVVGRRDRQFQAGDRVVGDPLDRLDVDAELTEPRASSPIALACSGRPSTTTAWRRKPATVVTRLVDRDPDRHPDGRHRLLDVVPAGASRIARRADQHAEGQRAADDHLLDVQHLDPVGRQRR